MIAQENGFKKQVRIEKAITRIGSSPANDIQLHSGLVSAFHLQILYAREMPDHCQVVNLTAEPVVLISNGQERSLAALSALELNARDEIRLKGVRLSFDLPQVTGILSTSHQISATLHLPEPVLRPNTTLVGRIALKNEGAQPSCQFLVEVTGIPEDCYQVDPIPLMYPGAQEDVNIRFYQRKTHPAAGFQSVVLSVTAPASYPGEQVSIQQGIYVSPVLEQVLQILDDMPAPRPVTPEPIQEPEPIVAEPQPQPVAAEVLPEPVVAMTEPVVAMAEPVPVMPEPAATAPEIVSVVVQDEPPQPVRRPLPVNPKVIKTPVESFWDE